MKISKNYDENDLLSKVLLMYFAFQHGSIGLFLVLESVDTLTAKSRTLKAMSQILPMDIWGIILLIAAVSFIVAVLQEGKTEYYFMILSGLAGGVTFGFLSMASMELSVNQTNTVNYMIIASIDFIVAVVGGVALWRRRDT
jgi:hypothetical protein